VRQNPITLKGAITIFLEGVLEHRDGNNVALKKKRKNEILMQ